MNVHITKPRKLKPSTKFFAKAKETDAGHGYYGQFSAPGLVPDIVSANGRPVVFATEDEAQLAAYQALELALNARLQLRMRFERIQKMSAMELSEGLNKADLTPTELAFIMQTDRVMGWLDGTHDIPHAVRIILGLCIEDVENIGRAERITEGALEKRTST